MAQDTLLDREVAFALIKTEGLDEVSRTRITREAQAMDRLGSHPHIVTVFDLGDHQGQPFMVTELMGGGDVEGVIEEATDHRLPLEQAIEIARETCRGLEFAHSRGIVHSELFSHMGNVGQDDWETFRKPEVQEAFPFPFWEETLGLLESLGIVEALSGEQALTSEVTAIPTPEHTPGSMSLAVVSGGQQALILGDVFHGPTQVTESDWVFSFDMDPGIAPVVKLLQLNGVETFEACQSGEGHCFPIPIVRFRGDLWAGYRAVTILMQHGIPVSELHRYWTVIDGELVGPDWEVTFCAERLAPVSFD